MVDPATPKLTVPEFYNRGKTRLRGRFVKFQRPNEKTKPSQLIHEIYRSSLARRISQLLRTGVCLTLVSESKV